MRNISSRFLTMKELEIRKTNGTLKVKTFNFVYQGPLVFPSSYSFMVKKRLEIERRKTYSPYCASQFSTLLFILCGPATVISTTCLFALVNRNFRKLLYTNCMQTTFRWFVSKRPRNFESSQSKQNSQLIWSQKHLLFIQLYGVTTEGPSEIE